MTTSTNIPETHWRCDGCSSVTRKDDFCGHCMPPRAFDDEPYQPDPAYQAPTWDEIFAAWDSQ